MLAAKAGLSKVWMLGRILELHQQFATEEFMKEDVKDVNIVITMADGDFQTISKWEER